MIGFLSVLAVLSLANIAPMPYEAQSVVVAFAKYVTVNAQTIVPHERLHALMQAQKNGTLADKDVPAYTSEQHTNRALLAVGTARIVRLFTTMQYGPVYRVTIDAPVPFALATLRTDSGVIYASADWRVSPMTR